MMDMNPYPIVITTSGWIYTLSTKNAKSPKAGVAFMI